ncbi:ABC transporter ATP-binding protein [Pedobacter sp. R20-19]|uniref:ATP-binding cassette domain-containing protein n=1 Tax=Pedobacter sp. R20-19 TaxID=1270196 RepID=UPI000493074C|nr:ABC transporter ATP-binding protein [Pedobacter sp. R20-19]
MSVKKNPYIQLAKFSWKIGKEYRNKQIIYYLIFVLSMTVSSVNPFLYKWLIDEIQTTDHVMKAIWIFALLSVSLKLVDWIIYAPIYLKTRDIAFELSTKFLVDLQHRVINLSTKWHQSNHTGATVDKIKKSSDGFKKFLNDDFHYIKVFFRFVFALGGMIYFAPLYGMVALLIGGIIVYLTTMLDHKYFAQLKQINEKDYIATSVLLDNLANHNTITSLKLQKQITNNFQDKVRQIGIPYFKSVKIDALKWAVVEILVVLIYVIMAVGYVSENFHPGQKFLVGGLVAMLAYALQFTSGFQEMAWLYALVIGTYADFSASESLRLNEKGNLSNGQTLEKTYWSALTLTNVNYVHTGDDIRQFTLSDINFKINNGKKIALVGTSGSGKTTFLKLIRGLYAHQNGSVMLDGVEIQWNQLEQLALFLPQEAEIFNDTILYNLCLDIKLDLQEIEKVCKMTLFDRVVKRLPDGLHTVIDQSGSNLSGGERQLLAITRCILLDSSSSVLLFDEPTSSIDPSSEKILLKNVFNHYADKSIIFTLHRHYLLPMFDYIYVMEEGKVIWEGSYQKMLIDESVSKYIYENYSD